MAIPSVGLPMVSLIIALYREGGEGKEEEKVISWPSGSARGRYKYVWGGQRGDFDRAPRKSPRRVIFQNESLFAIEVQRARASLAHLGRLVKCPWR